MSRLGFKGYVGITFSFRCVHAHTATAHAATWANFHEVFWGLPAMHRTSYGRDLGFACISGRFHCTPWVPTGLFTQSWSYRSNVSAVQQQHSPIPAAHRSVCFLHLLQLPCVLMGASLKSYSKSLCWKIRNDLIFHISFENLETELYTSSAGLRQY